MAGGPPLIGHQLPFHADGLLQLQAAQVLHGADADGALQHLVGLGLDPGDQLAEAFRRHVVGRHQEERIARQQRHRLKIGQRVVGDRHGDRREHHALAVAEHQRVAVGRRARHAVDADGAAATADVLDHDRLAERILHPLGQQPHQIVGDAAGGVGHYDGDRARWDRIGRAPVRLRRNKPATRRQGAAANCISSSSSTALAAHRRMAKHYPACGRLVDWMGGGSVAPWQIPPCNHRPSRLPSATAAGPTSASSCASAA